MLIVPPTPGAASSTYPQSYSDPSSSTLGTLHTQRSSSEATAETIFSLYGDDRNSWHSTNSHSLFRNNSLRESGSNYRPMSTANGDSSLSYLSRRSASSRSSAESDIARGIHPGIVHPIPPHAPLWLEPTQVQPVGTPFPRSSSHSQSTDGSRHHPPPSSIRSKSTLPSGPSSSSVDAPTITSAAQDRPTSARYQQSPPNRPHTTLQVNVNLSPHSHSSPPTSIAPPSPAPPRAPGEDLDAYHVRAVYAALDVSGVKGDGYEDGEELTRARLGSNRSLVRMPPSPGPSPPGGELTTAEKEILSHADR